MNASRLDSLELPLSTPGTLLTTPTWVYALMVVVTAALSIQLFEFVRRYAVNILFWDQWDFYDPLFEGKGWWDLFSWQHGPHRQGIGFVVTKWVLDLTAWDTVIEGYYIATLLILATGVALVIKKRLCGSLSGFDIVIPILCLTRIQYETIIITPNSSHSIFPFLLLCLLTYGLTWRNEWSKHITISLLTALLTYTGFGMFIWIVVIPLLCQLFIRYAVHRQLNGLIATTLALIIIMAAVLLFFKNYRFLPAVDNFQFPHERPLEYLLFVSLMFANFFGLKGINFISLGFGSLLLILTFGLFCKNLWYMIKEGGKIQIPDLISFVFCGFTLIYCTNVAVGRVVLG